jgi:hypothetical protein
VAAFVVEVAVVAFGDVLVDVDEDDVLEDEVAVDEVDVEDVEEVGRDVELDVVVGGLELDEVVDAGAGSVVVDEVEASVVVDEVVLLVDARVVDVDEEVVELVQIADMKALFRASPGTRARFRSPMPWGSTYRPPAGRSRTQDAQFVVDPRVLPKVT